MVRILFLSFFLTLFTFNKIKGQNMVINPSFEDYHHCPMSLGCVVPMDYTGSLYCKNWTRPTAASSDYYNVCATSLDVKIPVNALGYQFARTGNAYMGLIPLNDFNYLISYREYIQGELTVPLIPGRRYFVNYWVNKSDAGPKCDLDRLGAVFVNEALDIPGFTNVITDLSSSFVSPEFEYFDDTLNWQPVNGSFLASGGEEFIIIGNFIGLNETNHINCPLTLGLPLFSSYYYIDDVCVLDLESTPQEIKADYYEKCEFENLILEIEVDDSTYIVWYDGSSSDAHEFTEYGSYWVKRVHYYECTYSIDSIYIIPKIEFELDLGNDTLICADAEIVLGQEIDFVHTYNWSTGQSSPMISVSAPGMYVLEAISNCNASIDTIYIANKIPVTMYLPEDTSSCDGIIVLIEPEMNFTQNVNYQWSNFSFGKSIEVDKSGLYYLTVTDECGFSAKDSIVVDLIDCNNCLLMPNAFSPNGDGHNDVFYALSSCEFAEFHFKIFNRWGEAVFSSDKISQGWNGYYNGIPADAGVYFYMITALPVYPNSKSIQLKGDILLLR